MMAGVEKVKILVVGDSGEKYFGFGDI